MYFWCYYSQHQKNKQILKGQILQGAWILGNLAQARFSRVLYTPKFWLKALWKWVQMDFLHFLPYYDTNLFECTVTIFSHTFSKSVFFDIP